MLIYLCCQDMDLLQYRVFSKRIFWDRFCIIWRNSQGRRLFLVYHHLWGKFCWRRGVKPWRLPHCRCRFYLRCWSRRRCCFLSFGGNRNSLVIWLRILREGVRRVGFHLVHQFSQLLFAQAALYSRINRFWSRRFTSWRNSSRFWQVLRLEGPRIVLWVFLG